MAEPDGRRDTPGGCLAGFDAGQTHTLCRLVAVGSGELLAEAEGPGVSHLAAVGGAERFAEALTTSLARARHDVAVACPGERPPLRAAAIGASGIEAGSPVQEEGRRLAAASLELAPERVVVTGDERTALRGAFPQGAGIVVICGTGTIAVGRDAAGREHRCGGWGWLLDGAGSAMDIGRDGLALSLRMADGRLHDGPLRTALWRALGLDPADPAAPQRIKALVVTPEFGPAGFARLAPVLERLAREGDAEAAAILQRSADALAAMAAGVAGTLQLERPPVCTLGGAIEHLEDLQRRFRRALAGALPEARLTAPEGDACSGALAMAADLLAADAAMAPAPMSSPTPHTPGSPDPPAPPPSRPAAPGGNGPKEDPHRWSQGVTARSDALDLEPGVFQLEDPRAIAASLLRSAERSTRRKAPPFRSAMSMLCFYINRAGRNLSEERREVLEAAKVELRRLCGREG